MNLLSRGRSGQRWYGQMGWRVILMRAVGQHLLAAVGEPGAERVTAVGTVIMQLGPVPFGGRPWK
jgi:hypothetical protein